MKAISNILFFVSLVLFASPIFLYWWIHSSYERYLWIINSPYPLSHFGSFGYQVTLYGSLLLIGIGIGILATGLRSSQRITLVLGAFIISATLIGFSVFLSFPDNLEVRKPDWYQETAMLQKATVEQLKKLGVDEDVLGGWYAHRLNDSGVMFTKNLKEKVILGSEVGGASGGSIILYTLPITSSPEEWVNEKGHVDLDDVALVRESGWRMMEGYTILHTVHDTPGDTQRTEYIFTDNTIYALALSPFDENEIVFEELLRNIIHNVNK